MTRPNEVEVDLLRQQRGHDQHADTCLCFRWMIIGDINPLPPHLILTKSTTDLHFHIVGPLATSNEVQLSLTLNAFHDAVSLLLRGQVEKRSVLEGLDMVLLAADETIDDGQVS
jgi:hypothetical protein